MSGILHDNACIGSCPDGFYGLNSECVACDTGCETCTSASVCVTCSFSYYFYNNFCLLACPTVAPVIDSNGRCQPCSDSNCLTCNSLDQCSQCDYPTLLHLGKCLDSCPTDYTANGTVCFYDP